jgi:hypothetical protein
MIRILRRIRAILTPVFVLLLLWFFWGAVGGLYTVRPRATRRDTGGVADVARKGLRPIDDYLASMARREMFKQSVIYETKEKEVVNALGDLQFLGVVTDKGVSRAFIMNTKTGQTATFSVGENVDDLKIDKIQSDRVVFSHGKERLELIR